MDIIIKTVNPDESTFRSHYKSSLVMVYFAVFIIFSLLMYVAAWLPNNTLLAFFSDADNPLRILVSFFRFYLFTMEIMWQPFLLSFLIMLYGICWNAISTYRYLKKSGKRFVPLILMFPAWFIFIAIPFLSYIFMLIIQIVIYEFCLHNKVYLKNKH